MKTKPDQMHDVLDTLIQAIQVPILVVHENIILSANDSAGHLFGFPVASLLGKSQRDLILEEDRARFEDSLKTIKSGCTPQISLYMRFIQAGGGIVQLVVSISTQCLSRGGQAFIIVLSAPIAGQDDLNELIESEEHFRNLAESTPMAILLYQDDKWVFANSAAEKITGYSSNELFKMNFWDMVHPDFVQIGKERGKKRQLGQEAISSYELKICTKSGEDKWVLINGTSTHFRGKPAGLLNVIDITEIKKIQEELAHKNIQLNQKNKELQFTMHELESMNVKLHATNQELITSQIELEQSEYRFRDIFNNFPVGIFQTKLEGDFITANNEMARILGYANAGDVTTFEDNIRSYYTDLDVRNRLLDKVRSRGFVKGYETRFRNKKGDLIWVSINANLRRSADGCDEYLEGYIQDITAQKQAEEEKAQLEKQLIQAQKMEAIGRLAGGIAHDFNNLLTAIMGNAEIALKTASEGTAIGENINDILVTSKRAANLTRQLLAFSRKQVIKPIVIDINMFLVNLEKMLHRIIGETIILHIRRDPALALVKADPSQIEQLIVNLVVNARDAMPSGGTITIVSANDIVTDVFSMKNETILPGLYVRIDVTDTGSGMEKETMESIFEPFYSTKGEMGTGLGLSTVYGIVRQNDGFIMVESEMGKGSTFSVFLPNSSDGSPGELPIPGDNKDHVPVSLGETILVVEDEDNVRKLLVKNLADEGYRVLDASNSNDAIMICFHEQGPIDLILSDVVLPDIPGPKLVEKIRSTRSGIHVLYMSGYTEQNVINIDVLREGVFFIPKPFLPSELMKKIREVLSS